MNFEKKYTKVDRNDPVSRIAGYLKGETKTVPMVFDKNICHGFVNERLLILTRLNPKQKIRGHDIKVKVMKTDEEPLNIAKEMVKANCNMVPVGEDEKNVFGYTTSSHIIEDLTKDLKIGYKMGDVAVPVITLKKKDALGKAINPLRNFKALPIINDGGKLEGGIESRVIIEASVEKERMELGTYSSEKNSAFTRPVSSFSSPFSPNCDFQDILNEKIIDYLKTYRYCLVCKDMKPIGIITPLRILKYLIKATQSVQY